MRTAGQSQAAVATAQADVVKCAAIESALSRFSFYQQTIAGLGGPDAGPQPPTPAFDCSGARDLKADFVRTTLDAVVINDPVRNRSAIPCPYPART